MVNEFKVTHTQGIRHSSRVYLEDQLGSIPF